MARPRFHILATAPVAWAAGRRWGRAAAAGAVAGGVLIDADHLVDYAWARLSGERTHYFAPFHGWEVVAGLAAAAAWGWHQARQASALPDSWVRRPHPLAEWLGPGGVSLLAGASAGIAAGMFVHLLHDVVSNRPEHPGTYSLLFRIANGFEKKAVGWAQHPDFQGWSRMRWYQWI